MIFTRLTRILLVCLAAAPLAAVAQVQISVNLDRSRYIMFEPTQIVVSIRNDSGNDLNFNEQPDGSDSGYLQFEITDTHNRPVRPLACCDLAKSANAPKPCCPNYTRSGHPNPARGLFLPAGATRSVTVPIQSVYNLQSTGDYVVRARLGHRRLASDYVSKSVGFEIDSGQSLWERKTGIPTSSADSVIRKRTCSINVFHSEKGDVIYLKIEDDRSVYAVTRLGPGVKGVMPACDFDSLARLHVLLQVAPRLFRYSVFDLNGELKQEHVYLIDETVPRLHRDPDIGRVMVIGGRIAEEGIDYNLESSITMELREMPQNLRPVGTSAPEPERVITRREEEEKPQPPKKSFWKRLIPGGK